MAFLHVSELIGACVRRSSIRLMHQARVGKERVGTEDPPTRKAKKWIAERARQHEARGNQIDEVHLGRRQGAAAQCGEGAISESRVVGAALDMGRDELVERNDPSLKGIAEQRGNRTLLL